jgi:aerobic carbon-monoxide dehydrogenase medium subunit
VIPAPFAYERASSLDDALARLAESGGALKLLAGGQSLLPLMKLRLARPERLLDIGRLDELRGIRVGEDGALVVGALTTWAEMLADERVLAYEVLREALPVIGDLQVRNRGTIGGSLAHADPAADIAAAALAIEVGVVARSVNGERTIPIDEFLVGPFTTALSPDEILVEVRFPPSAAGTGSAYRFVAQPASGYPMAGVAAVVGREGGSDGRTRRCAVGVTGVGEMPYRARDVEAAILRGEPPEAAARLVTTGQTVGADIHADREYRATIAAVMVRRAIDAALERANAARVESGP